MATFDRAALAGSTLDAARAVLGTRLVRHDGPSRFRVGRIVEVEAYVGEDDLASHARFGRTTRNATMYGPPGLAYVYLVYGMYDCLNIVTEPEGRAAALLVRAVEPIDGIAAMRESRVARARARRKGLGGQALAAAQGRIRDLRTERIASGPGLVAAAFDIDRSDTGRDLCDPGSPIHIEPRAWAIAEGDVVATPRVGVAYAGEPWASRPWRFFLASSPSVSAPAGSRRDG